MPSLDTPMSYHRLKRAPLDDMEVFNSLRDLMDYCDNGARYDGQRVAVIDDRFGLVEYTIKNNIPIINMKGSEPIFEPISFLGDASTPAHGLLIYENNNFDQIWDHDEVFTFNEGKFCIISQLEIFRRLDAAGNKRFDFCMTKQMRAQGNIITQKWMQNYNPYDDGDANIINGSLGENMNAMSYYSDTSIAIGGWLMTNNTGYFQMPSSEEAVNRERNFITKIYVRAEEYYQACK